MDAPDETDPTLRVMASEYAIAEGAREARKRAADALERDRKVAEIVGEGCPEASPNRLVLLSARYRSIAALYPETGK